MTSYGSSAHPEAPPSNTPRTLRAAIEDLRRIHGDRYPQAEHFLKRLELPENKSGDGYRKLQREALLAHPMIHGTPVLFVVRPQYIYDHHNTETMYQTGEINSGKYRPGGPLKTVHLGTGITTIIHDPGPDGHLRDPDIRADGKRILFSMRRHHKENYHLYEIDADGSNLRQLTSAPGVFDIDPCYLPGGDIVFTSSRDPKYCGCNRHIMGNLFRMASDGANIHQVGKSGLFEGHSAMMPDGRVIYDRWEYVDRNFGDAQALWTMNPDGTNHSIFWGNNTASPGGVIDGKILPESGRCLCIFTSCHDLPWGALAIIDRNRGVDGKQSVVRTWPADAINFVEKGNHDTFKKVSPKYEDPWPVSETTFLVSRQIRAKEKKMGIFLIDTFGNELLLHAEKLGCFDPMPMSSMPVPPIKPVTRKYNNENGTFYMQNAHIGTHMKGVQPGEAQYLRVVEAPEKRNWTKSGWNGQGQQAPAMNWHNFENKRILGTVPIEKDGSAHFECPPDKFVFFQLLDQNKMMIQSMRSGTIIQPGATQGCVGCHESRTATIPPQHGVSIALRRPPSKLGGWMGKTQTFSYQREIQPIFTQHCVACHDFGQPAGKRLNLAADRTLVFNASYTDLWSLGYLDCIGGGPSNIQDAKSWGSHKSRLIEVLKEGHKEHQDVSLSQEELEKIITWVDLNAPYYPTYESAYPTGFAGRSPLNAQEMKTLKTLTGAKFVTGHDRGKRAQLSFERPELSPCLSHLTPDSKKHQQSLAIIHRGAARLQLTPRCDMQGFEPSEKDRKRLKKQRERWEIEQANRKAIQDGKKIYDNTPPNP
ncbi:MAG: hypothetical protein KJO21_08870 [Verrucomicrobiae bacterium]|nr:hypothetical protein [Verrucomicrobiae bacterium]NNJ42449.1 hypothetical protein [Akkermansiaceae bacterium]